FRVATLRAKLRTARPGASLAERRGALIGRVFQYSPHRCAIPPLFARSGCGLRIGQPSRDFSDRQSITTDPLEHLTNDGRLLVMDFISSLAIAFPTGNVTVAVRRGRQHVDAAARRCVTFAATTAFHDLS